MMHRWCNADITSTALAEMLSTWDPLSILAFFFVAYEQISLWDGKSSQSCLLCEMKLLLVFNFSYILKELKTIFLIHTSLRIRCYDSENHALKLFSNTNYLTHNMAMIQPSFTSSKWNMGENFGLKFHISYLHTP